MDSFLLIPFHLSKSIFHIEQLVTVEQHNCQDNNLVDRMKQNVSPHDLGDHEFVSFHWESIEQFIIGWFGGKSQRCQCIHDEIYPEHLNCVER